MSEARNQRFEIDIDEIERQLRRSVEMPAEPRPDPLAELARIVGQNDPFQGILSSAPARSAHVAPPANVNYGHPHGQPDPSHFEIDPAVSPHDHDDAEQAAFDPVSEAYGSRDDVLANDDYAPLPPRRSRLLRSPRRRPFRSRWRRRCPGWPRAPAPSPRRCRLRCRPPLVRWPRSPCRAT